MIEPLGQSVLGARAWDGPLDALVLGPHPDDIELFVGGTVARLCAAGRRVGLCDLTAGELASNGTPAVRRQESLEAARQLGVALTRLQLGLPDGGLHEHDAAQLRAVVGLIRRARPRLLLAPHALDRHPDHEAAGRMARRAVFFSGVHGFDAPGEPFRPAAVAFYLAGRDAEPSFLVDVSAHMPARRAAIAAYGSQFAVSDQARATHINRPGYLSGIEARLAALGARVGVEFAEGFVLESAPLVDDPVAWLVAAGEGGR